MTDRSVSPPFAMPRLTARAPVAGMATVALCWGGFGALVPDIKTRIGASDAEFGLALLLSTVGALTAMWLAPRLEARLGAAALATAAAFLTLAMLGPGWTTGLIGFTAAMWLVCVGSGALDVLANARTAQIEGQTGRSLMALVHALYSFAYAGAAVLTGLLRQAGWAPGPVMAVMALLALALCLVIARSPAPAVAQSGDTGQSARAPLALRLVLAGGAVILVAFMAEQATEGWSALHLERGLGASAAMGAMGPAILGVTMGLGRLWAHFRGHRWPPVTLILAGAGLAAIGAVIAAQAGSPGPAYLGFAALGLGVSVIVPTMMSLVAAQTAPARRTDMIARVSVIGYAGFFLGPPLMGGLAQLYGLPVSFLVLGTLLALVPPALVGLVRVKD